MAEKRSQRLQVVLQLANRQEQEVADVLAQQRQKLAQEQTQLQQLQQYSVEYQQQVGAKTRGLSAQELMSSRGFLQRLTQLQGNQQQKIDQLLTTLATLTEEWQRRYHKRNSIEKLISRLELEESDLLEKQLQREIDELTTQAFFQSRNDKN